MEAKKINKQREKGQGLIEVLVALGIFFIFVVGTLSLAFRYLDTMNKAIDLKEVEVIVEESLEAVQSIAYDSWGLLVDDVYGLDSSGGSWQFQANPDLIRNKYTRSVNIAPVNRDEDCNIVGFGEIGYYYSQTQDMFLEDEMRAVGADIYCKDDCEPNDTDAFLDNIANYDVIVMEDPHLNQGGTYNDTQKQTIIENYVSAGGNIFLTEHIRIDMLNAEFTSNGDNPATVIAADPYFAFNISETITFAQKPSLNDLGAQNFVELMRYNNDEIAMASWTFGNGLVYFISDIDTQYLGGTIEQVITDGILALSSSGSGILQEDPDTKLVTVAIDWEILGSAQSRSFSKYFTRWKGPTTCMVIEVFNYAIHSNQNIHLNNSTGTITGDINAGGSVNQGSISINGTVTEQSVKRVPTVNFSSYEAIADYTEYGNKTFEEGETYNGIWYVDGNVTIESDVTINGTIIAMGNINLSDTQNVIIIPTSPYPALVADGNIIGGNTLNSVINRLIYAVGNINMDYNTSLTVIGSIITNGNVELQDGINITITYDPDLEENPPPYFE